MKVEYNLLQVVNWLFVLVILFSGTGKLWGADTQSTLVKSSISMSDNEPLIVDNKSQIEYKTNTYIITRQDIAKMPYRDLASLLNTLPGFDAFDKNLTDPVFRGESLDDTRIIIDGMEMSDLLTETPYYYMDLGNIEKIEVLPGWFGVEYGNARNAIIKITTRKSAQNFILKVNTRYSAPGLKHFGPMMYGKDSPIVTPFTTLADGAWTGYYGQGGMEDSGTQSQFTEGWFKYSGINVNEYGMPVDINGDVLEDIWDDSQWVLGEEGGLYPGDPHYGKPYENLALYLWRHRSGDNLDLLRELGDKGLVDISLINVNDDDAFMDYGNDIPDWQGEVFTGGIVPYLPWIRWSVYHSQDQLEYARKVASSTYYERTTRVNLNTSFTKNMNLDVTFQNNRQNGMTDNLNGNYYSPIAFNAFTIGGSANKLWYPDFYTPVEYLHRQGQVRFNHKVTEKINYHLDIGYAISEQNLQIDNRNTAPIYSNEWNATHLRYGRLGTLEEIYAHVENGDYGWENWRNWARIRIGNYLYDEAPAGYGPINWLDVTGEYRMESGSFRSNESMDRRFTVKGKLNYTFHPKHKLELGFEWMRNHYYVDYEIMDPSVGGGYFHSANIKPLTGSIYLADTWKPDEKFMLYAGIRYDMLKHDDVLAYHDTSDDSTSSIYSHMLQPGYVDYELATADRSMSELSYRLGVIFQPFSSTQFFMNHGKFSEWADAKDLYAFTRSTARGYLVSDLCNPMLKAPYTIRTEAGFTQDILNQLTLKASMYYTDETDLYSGVTYYPMSGNGIDYIENNTYIYKTGYDVELDYIPSPWFTASTSFSYTALERGRYGYSRYYQDEKLHNPKFNIQLVEYSTQPLIRFKLFTATPHAFGPGIGPLYPVGDWNMSILYYWKKGECVYWEGNEINWRPYQNTDMRISKTLFSFAGAKAIVYMDVNNLFNNKNMVKSDGYIYTASFGKKHLIGASGNLTWNDHRWWNREFVEYMNSLDIDGGDRPGDYPHNGEKEYIEMPKFTPWTFLNKRDIFWGLNIQVNI